jgi:hypothetical protein
LFLAAGNPLTIGSFIHGFHNLLEEVINLLSHGFHKLLGWHSGRLAHAGTPYLGLWIGKHRPRQFTQTPQNAPVEIVTHGSRRSAVFH